MGRRYAVIGTGAIGGFYGACLQNAGQEVHFLLRRDYEYVRHHGLVISSIYGDFTLPQVNAYNDVKDMPRCDVVLIALKTTQNHLLPHLLPPLVKEGGVVLTLQNGLGIEPEIASIVGENVDVLGGLCFICSNKVSPGQIHHLDYGQIQFAAYSKDNQPVEITPIMRQLGADFEQAGIPIQLSKNLLLSRWKKLVWNIPFNGLSVVLDATTDAIINDSYGQKMAEQLMREVVAAAAGYGLEIKESFIQKMLEHTVKMKPYRTSMKIDYDSHRPLEIEAIFGNPIRAAQNMSVPVPQITMLYQQLKFLDA
ncbi:MULTISPECIES: putative 2-dehydropantoate 2-reductase [unclassified Coleofasciculus]|uniref:putative 2-dehydropantoate 2-reductase n=1 Tax=unclassified Coleofasciculus TaxID=2692782 RepID=UPI001880C1C3|nr:MULTISPECIES: putative 2-dehydropantoate 2-reductase [unclassified Coleofasciculus]MBE9128269.1 putative 2-dehydropantoate 2-reductase [Coleofasciculus sp. LEGE 07081]MBE9151316.1 putative 2-dehydropantoate 2-reductase [Coleofasciculus sp. LEGE 07092]